MLLKCNSITGELHRTTELPSSFNEETNHAEDTFFGLKYSERFVNSVMGTLINLQIVLIIQALFHSIS